MGYFSFLTADTQETICVGDFVFILFPDGDIFGGRYDGYGRVIDPHHRIDVFELLAERNGFPNDREKGIKIFYRKDTDTPNTETDVLAVLIDNDIVHSDTTLGDLDIEFSECSVEITERKKQRPFGRLEWEI